MDDHLRILQQGIEAVAIVPREEFKVPLACMRPRALNGLSTKLLSVRKKIWTPAEDDAYVRHQFAILVAIGDQDGENVDGKKKTPEEERAFLPGPERRDFIKRGKVAVAVGDHVGHGEIVGEEADR